MESMLTLLQLGVVVVGDGFKPTHFHPAQLARYGVVPEDWETTKEIICNEAISHLQYPHNIHLTAQPDKFLFVQAEPDEKGDDGKPLFQISDIAIKFFNSIKYDPVYTAIGINPKAVFVMGQVTEVDPAAVLMERIFKNGPWKDHDGESANGSAEFTFRKEDCRITITIEPVAKIKNTPSPITGIMFSGNYHYDLSGSDQNSTEIKESLIHHLVNWEKDVKSLMEYSEKVVGEIL